MRARSISIVIVLLFVPLLGVHSARAQSPPPQSDALSDTLRELQDQIRELQQAVKDLREESARFRAETIELRSERARSTAAAQASHTGESVAAATAEENEGQRIAKIEEDVQLLNGKVDEQYQTKVESASKYRVRLSGIALFNLFSNRGVVENIDNPAIARSPSGFESGSSFGGSLRQSLIGLEAFGPNIAGARTSGDVQFDFAGGFPESSNAVTFGLVRLRTARLRLQWKNTSVIGGQDGLFFAPLAPTSFASLSTPALSYAGNLWAWIPQLRVEHTIPLSDTSSVSFAVGILDGVTGEPPASDYLRTAQAGEQSGQPAYATRAAWSHTIWGSPLTLGAGAYYNRQNWGFNRSVDGWAAVSDIKIPLGRWFTLSGEFYRGRAIGGLAAATGRSVVFNGELTDPATQVLGLNSVGAWTQLKFSPTAKLEFNGAFGQDNPFASDLRRFTITESHVNSLVARNREAFANVIVRPRSDLVLSLEYRHLRTFELPRSSESADHINLSAGVLF